MGLIALSGGLIIAFTAVIGHFFVDYHRLHLEAALKQQMLDRGMSAEEIQEVCQVPMAATSRSGCARGDRLRGRSRAEA
jgi:hypothetical protein